MFRRILSPRQNRSQSSGTLQLPSSVPEGEEEIKNLSYGDPDKLNSPVRSQSMIGAGDMSNPPLPPRNMRPSHQDSESSLYVAPADTLKKSSNLAPAAHVSSGGVSSTHGSGTVDTLAESHPTKSELKVMQMHQLTMSQRKAGAGGPSNGGHSHGHQRTGSLGHVTENSDYSVPFNLVQQSSHVHEKAKPPVKPPRMATPGKPERQESSERLIVINPTSPTPATSSDRSNTNSPSSPLSYQTTAADQQDPPASVPKQDSDYAVPWDRSKFLQNIPHRNVKMMHGRRKNEEDEETSGSFSSHRSHRENVQLHPHHHIRSDEGKIRSGSLREPSPPLPSRGNFRNQSAREPLEYERESSPTPPDLPFDPHRPHRNRAVSDKIPHLREGSASPVAGAALRKMEDMNLHSGPHRGHHLHNPPPSRHDHTYPAPPPWEQSTKDESRRHSGASGPAPPSVVTIDVSIPLEDQPWYHGSITRAEAEDILRDQPDFSFLVRKSESCQTDFSLSIRDSHGFGGGFFHLRLVYELEPQPGYVLGQFSNQFENVTECIANYTKQRLNIRGAEHKRLRYPIPRSAPLNNRGFNIVGV